MIEVKEWRLERERMVQEQIIARGIKDERVIDAMLRVPRHLFVDKTYYHQAYNDYPLPIGWSQTISQPYMVAVMTELLELKGNESVLEVGTGSGYQTAILALLCARVFTIERISELSFQARKILFELGFNNINFLVGDGSLGWPEFAPYDGIIVTAGAPAMPRQLVNQLTDKGKMLIPIGGEYFQTLNVIKKHRGSILRKQLFDCSFVPLLGKEGWNNNSGV